MTDCDRRCVVGRRVGVPAMGILLVMLPFVLGQETASTKGPNTTTTIAFGSCHKNRKAAVPSIWEVMLDERARERPQGPLLDAFVWTGDTVYPPHRDPLTGKKRYGPSPTKDLGAAFHELKTNATIGYTRLLKEGIPVYGTWDDHDFGGNDMGKFMPDKEEREENFWDFLGYRPAPHDDPNRRGVYHSVDLEGGRLKLILLDTRSFREDHCVPSLAHRVPIGNALACATRWATSGLHLWKLASWWGQGDCVEANVLGEDQWEWLEKELLSSTAELNIVVSSVQVWSTNPAMESWGQFPTAQKRLWNLLEKHYHGSRGDQHRPRSSRPGPVVVWSGDVHHAEIIGQPGYLEITSSGMTHHCGQPFLYGKLCRPLLENFRQHRHAPDDFYIGLNYGLLQVDWQKKVATFRIQKASDGSTVLEVEQPLDYSTDGARFRLPPFESLPRTWNGHLIPWARRVIVALVLGLGIASRLMRETVVSGGHRLS